jgi:hypothetical protein
MHICTRYGATAGAVIAKRELLRAACEGRQSILVRRPVTAVVPIGRTGGEATTVAGRAAPSGRRLNFGR